MNPSATASAMEPLARQMRVMHGAMTPEQLGLQTAKALADMMSHPADVERATVWASRSDAHGDADRTAPFEQSELMEADRRKAGVEIRLIRIPSGEHGVNFEGAADPPDFLGEMVRWLDRHLRASTTDSKRR